MTQCSESFRAITFYITALESWHFTLRIKSYNNSNNKVIIIIMIIITIIIMTVLLLLLLLLLLLISSLKFPHKFRRLYTYKCEQYNKHKAMTLYIEGFRAMTLYIKDLEQ